MQDNPFAQAEQGRTLGAHRYKQLEPELRQQLLDAQQTLRREARFPVLLIFSGLETAGKGETLARLNEWMDPRWLLNRAYGQPSDEERERPEFWRYWRDLPPRGRIGLFLGGWYHAPLHDYSLGRINATLLDRQLRRIERLETMLAADGALILKFWLHLDRDRQLERLRQLTEDPLQRWRVGIPDWQQWHYHPEFTAAGARILRASHKPHAPWHVIEGWDANYRNLAIGALIRDAIRDRLLHPQAPDPATTVRAPAAGKLPKDSPLCHIASPQALGKVRYRRQLREQQALLSRWHRVAAERGLSTVLVFEGPDAAGKGGAIRRVTAALEPSRYQVLPIAAPSDEERAHHYLWRFWRHLGRAGRFTLFDRSWYGRVLVERVEGLADSAEWSRAYDEINQFESELTGHGMLLIKFWLWIDKDEQLRRFRERDSTPHKRWKLTEEDWRNRERWDDYARAAHDMLMRTDHAPWSIIAANDKHRTRIDILRTLNTRLKETLHQCPANC